MDFLNKIGSTITEKGHQATDKAKELAAVANLKNQISTHEQLIRKNEQEIGKLYVEQYSDMPEPLFEKQVEAIVDAKKAIEDLKAQIEQLSSK